MASKTYPILSKRRNKRISSSMISPTPFNPHAITAPQVDIVYSILVRLGLTSHIATEVLNLAEYWCRQSYNIRASLKMKSSRELYESVYPYYCRNILKERLKTVRNAQVPPLEYTCLYLQTDPLGVGQGFDEFASLKPQKVAFTIISSDNNPLRGPSQREYYNQYSWFEVSIFREDESFVPSFWKPRKDPMQVIPKPSSSLKKTGRFRKYFRWGSSDLLFMRRNCQGILPKWLTRDGPDQIVGGFNLVKNGEDYIWLLKQNRSCQPLLEHRIEWTRDGNVKNLATDAEAKKLMSNCLTGDEKEGLTTGAGSGRNFIASLQRGDRIGIWAKVMNVSISKSLLVISNVLSCSIILWKIT
jgi:hypothetical protein